MPEELVEESKAEIAELLSRVNAHAERQAHVLGWDAPTPWDIDHRQIDWLLQDWEQAKG